MPQVCTSYILSMLTWNTNLNNSYYYAHFTNKETSLEYIYIFE